MAARKKKSWIVVDYNDSHVYEGEPSAELVRQSLAAGDSGAVNALPDSRGVWQYIREDDVDRHARRGDDVTVVYVDNGKSPLDNPGDFDGSKRQELPAFRAINAVVVREGNHSLRVGTKVIVVGIDPNGVARCAVGKTGTAHVPTKCLEVSGGDAMRHKMADNPPLVIFGNPGRSRGRMLSRRAIAIQYIHAEDGQAYSHKFGAGDEIILASDGKSFTVRNKDGKRLWKDF